MYNILVCDDDKEIVKAIEIYLTKEGYNVLKSYNGNEALKILANNEIHLVILDIMMPGKDGIEILEEMKNEGLEKHVIIVSSYKKEYSVKMASKYNIDYYMLKPFSLESIEKRIIEVVNNEEPIEVLENKENNIQMAISKLLHSLGVPSHIKGYQYIRESIYMMYTSKEMIGGITKEIYPEIALRFDTTASRVERAIRHAIEVSWSRGDYELMEEIFGHSVDYDRAKPTNSEFIATLADRLKIDQNLVLS